MSLRTLLIALLWIAAGPALAAEQSAKDFVTAIYQTYIGKDAKGIPIDSRKARSLLSPSLMKLIDADAKQAARRNEVPELDGDPFVDAQDWDIQSFSVAIEEIGPAKARATVAFKDAASPDKKPVRLDLIKTKAGWRIDDFTGASGSARAYLTKKR